MLKQLSLVIVFVGAVFLLFFKLDQPELERWDEQTNVQIVQETLNHSNPLILQYKGVTFAEKPPLWHYLTMTLVRLFGPSPLAFRLVSAISGLVICLMLFLLGKKHFGFNSGLVVVVSFLSISHLFINNPVGEGQFFSTHTLRSADLDALQIMFFLASLWFADRVKLGLRNFYLVFATLALALLTKGPFALVPLAFYCWYFYRNRVEYKLKGKHLITGLVLFLLIAAPWHVLMLHYAGTDFLSGYLGYHIIDRLAIPLEGHSADLFFYFKIIFNFSFFALWPLALLGLLQKFKTKTNLILDFSVVMFLSTFILFSVVQTKLAWYILPIYPFAALLVAFLYSRIGTHQNKVFLRFALFTLLLISLVVNILNIYLL